MAATTVNIAALVERMPDTDKDLQIKKDGGNPDRLGAASKFTGPDPGVAETIFTEIISGGSSSILALINLVREPGDADFKSYKAGYVLHGLVLHAGRPGNDAQKQLLAGIFTSQLDNERHSKSVKTYLIRELRIIGGPDSVAALGRQLRDEALCGDAAQALLTLREGAAPQFRAALPQAAGRNRVTIIHALGTLRDAESAGALKQAITDPNEDVRQMASWALANLSVEPQK